MLGQGVGLFVLQTVQDPLARESSSGSLPPRTCAYPDGGVLSQPWARGASCPRPSARGRAAGRVSPCVLASSGLCSQTENCRVLAECSSLAHVQGCFVTGVDGPLP